MATIVTGKVSAALSERFDDGRKSISEFLSGIAPNLTELAEETLAAYLEAGHKFCAGWQFPCDFDGLEVGLRVLLDEDFPFSSPKIGLSRPNILRFAHLERGALLCLPPGQTVAWDRPADALAKLLSQAEYIITRGLSSDEQNEDSRREIIAYWRIGQSGKLVTSYLDLDGISKRFVRLDDGGRTYFFDNRNSARDFFVAGGRKLKPTKFCKPAMLIWLQRPPRADELPKTVSDLIRLLLDDATSGLEELAQFLAGANGRSTIALGFSGDHGFGLLALDLPKLHIPQGSPTHLAFVTDSDQQHSLKRLLVRRADPPWVFGRDSNPEAAVLQTKSVAMIGAGSLGSFVAEQLASSGVGQISIIDPETLAFENTSRHVLGAEAVDLNKAEALAMRLQRRFRTSAFRGVPLKWQNWVLASKPNLSEFDLIISTVGDWPSEAHLTEYMRSNSSETALMFAWLEPHALASHSVLVPTPSPCFCCGFDTMSTPQWRVTDWATATRRAIPLCGGQYQPYGITALTTHAASISESAIAFLIDEISLPSHVVRSSSDPGEKGGRWSSWWEESFEGQPLVDRRLVREWPVNADCAMCGDG